MSAPVSAPLARVEGLRVAFRSTVALDGVHLEVHRGEVLGLVGPNGGGKTTLLQALAGLLRPTAGAVTVDGLPAHRLALQGRGTVGLITAAPGLYPLLTGWENLAFFGALYGLSAAEVRERTADFVDHLGLRDALARPAGTGSSGMKQKLSLARALLMDPPLLLLDEPTSNLDPLAAEVIHRTTRAHADRGNAVVWVTHDLHAAEQLCDRVAVVAGRILHVEAFAGPRGVPARTRLLQVWRHALGDAA